MLAHTQHRFLVLAEKKQRLLSLVHAHIGVGLGRSVGVHTRF